MNLREIKVGDRVEISSRSYSVRGRVAARGKGWVTVAYRLGLIGVSQGMLDAGTTQITRTS